MAKKSDKSDEPAVKLFLGMPKKITKLLETESDRGAILILAAYLEEILALVIGANCVSEGQAHGLMEFRRPAGDFDSKITLCSAFALISPDEASALNHVRKIRNQAAHFDKKGGRGFDVLFDSKATSEQVAGFAKSLNQEWTTFTPASMRRSFTLCCRLLAIRLYFRLLESRRPLTLKSSIDVANEARVRLKGTTHGKILDEIENAAVQGDNERLFNIFQSIMQSIKATAEKQKS